MRFFVRQKKYYHTFFWETSVLRQGNTRFVLIAADCGLSGLDIKRGLPGQKLFVHAEKTFLLLAFVDQEIKHEQP